MPSRLALERLAVVAPPGGSWATVLGALLDGFDLVVAAPDRKVRPADARRLTARARERGTVVVLAGGGAVSAWPEGADLRLALTTPDWEGLGRGHGHLQRRRVVHRDHGAGVGHGRGSQAHELCARPRH